MSNNVYVSVIIPVYNMSETIIRALESVQQSIGFCENYIPELKAEVVVVDDCSTDDSLEKIKKFTEGHTFCKYVVNKSNTGAGASRNYGVRQSVGDYLFFLDADDIYLEEHIYFCLDVLLKNPEMHYVASRFKLDEPVHPEWKPAINASGPVNICLRRWVHDCIGGFPEETVFKEYGNEDIVYRLLLNYFITRQNAIVAETVKYFRHPGNSLDQQIERFKRAPGEYDDFNVLTEKQKQLHPQVQKRQKEIIEAFEQKLISWMHLLAGKTT